MNLHCPCCHARIPLEAALEDGAARELVALLGSRPVELSRPLVSYLGLFRSQSRALAWERALRLAWEVLELEADPTRLGLGLAETVEAIRAKRQREPARPLTNHNYLKRVLESVTAGRRPEAAPPDPAEPEPEPPGAARVHEDVQPRLGRLLEQVGKPVPKQAPK